VVAAAAAAQTPATPERPSIFDAPDAPFEVGMAPTKIRGIHANPDKKETGWEDDFALPDDSTKPRSYHSHTLQLNLPLSHSHHHRTSLSLCSVAVAATAAVKGALALESSGMSSLATKQQQQQ
jgi:hypothetical protein